MTNRSVDLRRLVLLAQCTAVIFVGKFALFFLYNIEVVTFLLIIFTLTFKLEESLFISTVYTIIEALLLTLSEQAYIWTLIVLVTWLFKKIIKENFLSWAIFSGAFGLLFGTLSTIPILLLLGKTAAISYFFANLPFDVVHMVGNYLIMLLFGELVYKTLQRLIKTYNL